MQKKQIELSEVLAFLGDMVIRVEGSVTSVRIDNLADVQHTVQSTLDWVNPVKENKQEIAEASAARVILVDESVVYSKSFQQNNKVLIVVKDPKTALAKVGNEFFVEHQPHSIHPTALIDPMARIGKNVNIGPYCIIGKCTIGDNTFIDSNVKIFDGVQIGESCVFRHGCIVGGESVAYQKDDNGNRFHFPQLGGLIIGHHVEVGIYSQIDKGALSDTVVGDYVKLGSQCHISHNDKVGNNVVLTGGVILAGSVSVGENTWISTRVIANPGHIIGKDCFLSTASVINQDIPDGEMWAGSPAKRICKTSMMK